MQNAIVAEGIGRSFPGRRALTGVDLAVPAGTVFGLLGPNGAGKTTLVRILTTLLAPDSGRALVAGHDVVRRPRAVRRAIGVTGQLSAVDERLTGRENLELVARLHHLHRPAARYAAADLIDRFGLDEVADRPAGTYSGGTRRRLDLAASLIGDPEVLFLDEPTTGLDLTSRLLLWQTVRDQAARGTTVLLTTQYLEEADQLATQIAVIDGGRLIAEGTPDELKRQVGGARLELCFATPEQAASALCVLTRLGDASGSPTPDETGCRVSVAVDDPLAAAGAAAEALRGLEVTVRDFALRRPSLDDVFLSLTGHSAATQKETVA